MAVRSRVYSSHAGSRVCAKEKVSCLNRPGTSDPGGPDLGAGRRKTKERKGGGHRIASIATDGFDWMPRERAILLDWMNFPQLDFGPIGRSGTSAARVGVGPAAVRRLLGR